MTREEMEHRMWSSDQSNYVFINDYVIEGFLENSRMGVKSLPASYRRLLIAMRASDEVREAILDMAEEEQ